MNEPVRSALAAVAAGGRLTASDAEHAVGAILDGEASPVQIAGLLVGLRVRGETAEELAGFVAALRARMLPVDAPPDAIDTCGTGGDGAQTFNISTAAALLVAGAGVPVAKHGNRAVSSRSGSSDAIEALGIPVESTPADAALALREDGFAYLHAPAFHPGMRHPGPVRRELGFRTAFNLVGPLANPARVRRQLVGVADPGAAAQVAAALRFLGTERAFVVHGGGVDPAAPAGGRAEAAPRIDELPLDGTGRILDVGPDGITEIAVDPRALGLAFAPTRALAVATPAESAARIEAILAGRETGPARDVVVLNAGAALVVAGRAPDLAAGVALALHTIASGAAQARLARIRSRAAVPTGEPA